MNDVPKDSLLGLVLKLHWPTHQNSLADDQSVVVDLRFAGRPRLISISIPSDQFLHAVAQRLELYPSISPNGFVSVLSDEIPNDMREGNTVPLDQLVAEALNPDMLEDEPQAAQMLSEFRTRLLRSLEHVERAIASLQKD